MSDSLSKKISSQMDQNFLSDPETAKVQFEFLTVQMNEAFKNATPTTNIKNIPLRPIFLESDKIRELSSDCEKILKLSYRIFIEDFKKNKSEFLLDPAFPEFLKELIPEPSPHFNYPHLARPDVLISGGTFKIAELNVGYFAGMLTLTSLQNLIYHQSKPIMRLREKYKLFSSSPLPALTQYLSEQAHLRQNGLFITSKVMKVADPEMEYYLAKFSSSGLNFNSIYLEDIEIDPSNLKINNSNADWVLRMVPIDFLMMAPGQDHVFKESFEKYLKSALKNKDQVHQDQIWSIITSKQTLSMLWEKIETLSNEEQSLVKRIIPWTAHIQSSKKIFTKEGSLCAPEEFLSKIDKNKFVIKNGFGFAELFVCIGALTNQDDWDEKCKTALKSGACVIQEYLPADTCSLPFYDEAALRVEMKVVEHEFGLYLIGGKFSGLISHFKPVSLPDLKPNWSSTVAFGISK